MLYYSIRYICWIYKLCITACLSFDTTYLPQNFSIPQIFFMWNESILRFLSILEALCTLSEDIDNLKCLVVMSLLSASLTGFFA